MRKFQKEQLLDIFTSLHELHRECRDKMEQKEYQTVRTALSDCQEAAIQTGEAIEQLVGEGTEAVAFLEQYCERLYNLSMQLEELSAQKFYKSLEEVLIKAENAVKHMPVRKEVVFFPYKASMWDSLESVYLAAKEDENCDAYCVPIPYYDRRADGSIGQMHYEGNEYPKNIEVIDYRTYNLEERHPDAIYIHNPYDEWNHVTCVPERYFARNLRNYTDELVYIPYFVLGEIEPDDQATIDSMKHFCFTPGVIYSHKVIVQSEKMRQIYINEYIKAAKESGLSGEHTDRKYLEQKILGLGSPKFDKVLNTKKEDLDIPEEWLRIIEKPDGSWKKIIFYNTSINALLQHDEKMLEKMKDVFRIFKDNQDEIALLWRPHPLIKTTIESMRPQLWQEYSKIVEQYRSEGWGIYDDSADMDRAVILSDAYYGDGSSVVPVYQKTGKPVMVQNVSLEEFASEIELSDATVVGDKIWICPEYFSKLILMDVKTKRIEECYDIPVEKGYGMSMCFGSMALVKQKMYLIPYREKSIYQFETDSKRFTIIKLETDLIKGREGLFSGSRICGKYLFIMGANVPAVIRIDTTDNSIDYITDWVDKIKPDIFCEKEVFFKRQSILLNQKIYIPFCNANAILEIDPGSMKTQIYKLGVDNLGYSGICYSGGDIWLVSQKHEKIVKWNYETKEVSTIDIPKKEHINNSFIGIINVAKRTILLPRIRAKNFENGENEEFCVMNGSYSFVHENDSILMYYENISGILSLYNKYTNELSQIEVKIGVECLEFGRIFHNAKIVLQENRNLNIISLINNLTQKQEG